MDIDHPVWTDAGRADAARYGFTYSEVIDAFYAETSIRVLVAPRNARMMLLGGTHGRVMVITADREHRNIAVYRITEVRPATYGENTAWEKRQP